MSVGEFSLPHLVLHCCFGSFSSGLFKYVQHACSLEIFTLPLKCFNLNCIFCLFFSLFNSHQHNRPEIAQERIEMCQTIPSSSHQQAVLEVSLGANAQDRLSCTSIFYIELGPPAWGFQHNLVSCFTEYGITLWFAFRFSFRIMEFCPVSKGEQ